VSRHVVGIGGAQRPRSSSELLVRAVLAECERLGARTTMFDGAMLAGLPHYNPEDPGRTAAEQTFVDTVRGAHGLVIGTPGYHGGVSGIVKNAIDLLEDTRGDERVYLDAMPVGLVVSAAGWQAGGVTLSALRGVVHAMRGWPTPVGIAINSTEQRPFAADGSVQDPAVGRLVTAQARQIMGFRLEPLT
jgi:FMN reductase